MNAHYVPTSQEDKARHLLVTARALLACWICSLPMGQMSEAKSVSTWQTAMRGLCELLDDAAAAYGELQGLVEEACLVVMYAQGIAHCIEGALWEMESCGLGMTLTDFDLSISARYVDQLLQQAIEALPSTLVRKGGAA